MEDYGYGIKTNMPLTKQVEILARFIMENIEGEPSRSEGTITTAIRLLNKYCVCA